MLNIKEIFGPTIEGEGLFTGEKCLFIRLAGCNIWDGKEETKKKSMCPYCDTDFTGGDVMSVEDIISAVKALGESAKLVNITGGEPLLQDITELCLRLIEEGFYINIETNGTKALPLKLARPDVFVTCSPKVPRKALKMNLKRIDCIKVLYPHQSGKINPEDFNDVGGQKYIQPIEKGGQYNFDECMQKLYSMSPEWKLSVQLHKLIGAE